MPYTRGFKNNQNQQQHGRYNTPGQFVPASTPTVVGSNNTEVPITPAQQYQTETDQWGSALPTDTSMEQETTSDNGLNEDGTKKKPAWMKSGIKKISNKERRRRQNEHLRKLITPKNALMVLNEMIASQGQQQPISANCNVQQTDAKYFGNKMPSFCAQFNVEGQNFTGYGETKMGARNAAAEQAIRALVVKRMQKSDEPAMDSGNGEEDSSDQVPMIQLASYALHKLFNEWQFEGMPPLTGINAPKPNAGQILPVTPKAPKSATPKAPKSLPENAAQVHPCMLLCTMRQGLIYHELGVEGDKPQNMMYTMGVTVDGTTYIGKAPSKKEARKQAARSACQEVFKVQYTD